MDKLIINPHSIVDIITNSSTVIYTGVTDNAAEMVRGIIKHVLEISGSDKTVDELFDISVVNLSAIEEEMEEYEYGSPEHDVLWDKYNELRRSGQHQVDVENLKDMDMGVYNKSRIMVSTKRSSKTNIISDLLSQIFVVEADYS